VATLAVFGVAAAQAQHSNTTVRPVSIVAVSDTIIPDTTKHPVPDTTKAPAPDTSKTPTPDTTKTPKPQQ